MNNISNNNMACDLNTGVCGTTDGDQKSIELIDFNSENEIIDLYYFTDPICSHCWSLEPVLNKLKAEYSDHFNFHVIMGGMIKNWTGFSDAFNGISEPSDVAYHWREVGEQSRMPIDGSLWYNNPVNSSYPPSRVFKVIQKTNEKQALTFLRKAREAVFAFNRNIANDDVLIDIVNLLGLDGETIIGQANQPASNDLLKEDIDVTSKFGVSGFPTIIMKNKNNKGIKIVGSRPYEVYVDGIKQIFSNGDVIKTNKKPDFFEYFKNTSLLFSKEIEVLYNIDKEEVKSFVAGKLPSSSYQFKEILGELYIEKTILPNS